jgi:hypothetical protein
MAHRAPATAAPIQTAAAAVAAPLTQGARKEAKRAPLDQDQGLPAEIRAFEAKRNG